MPSTPRDRDREKAARREAALTTPCTVCGKHPIWKFRARQCLQCRHESALRSQAAYDQKRTAERQERPCAKCHGPVGRAQRTYCLACSVERAKETRRDYYERHKGEISARRAKPKGNPRRWVPALERHVVATEEIRRAHPISESIAELDACFPWLRGAEREAEQHG